MSKIKGEERKSVGMTFYLHFQLIIITYKLERVSAIDHDMMVGWHVEIMVEGISNNRFQTSIIQLHFYFDF